MVNGVIDSCPGAHDLGLEQGDTRVKFVYRERVEVLPGKLRKQVARRPGLDVVEIHGCKVDPFGDAVNKPSTNRLACRCE